jgi:hypothetical protein
MAVASALPWLSGCGAAAIASAGSAVDVSSTSTTSPVGVSTLENLRSAVRLAQGGTLALSDTTIKTRKDSEAGAMVTEGGLLTLSNVDIITSGAHSVPLAVGSGGGSIDASGGKFVSSGIGSPDIYSMGAITLTRGVCKGVRSEAAVVEGTSSVVLTDVAVSSKCDSWAVRIFRTDSYGVATPGAKEAAGGSFTMTGGSLVYAARAGSLFYVTNCAGVITLSGVDVVAISGPLLWAAAGSWGAAGRNGGNAVLNAVGQDLSGNLTADAVSTLSVVLSDGSSLAGAINPEATAKEANLTLDSTSTWKVTADSYLAGLTLTAGISGDTIPNIKSGGHTVYYDTDCVVNAVLGGKTYSLPGGGSLKPAN